MNELKDMFATSVDGEPPVRTGADEIMRQGRARQRFRNGAAVLCGSGVAAIAIAVIVAFPGGSAPGGGLSAAAASASTDTEAPAPPQNADPTPAEAAAVDDSDFATVKASHDAKLASIVAATLTHLGDAGYTVTSSGADDAAALDPDFPAGLYLFKAAFTKSGVTGAVVVHVGGDLKALPPTACDPGLAQCSLVALPSGGSALFYSEPADASGTSARVATFWPTSGAPTEVRALAESGGLPQVSDTLLTTIGTDASTDLSGVVLLTDQQAAQIRAARLDKQGSVSADTKAADDKKRAAILNGGDNVVAPASGDAKAPTLAEKMAEDAKTRATSGG